MKISLTFLFFSGSGSLHYVTRLELARDLRHRLLAPRHAIPGRTIRRPRPCGAGKRAHGHPRTTPDPSVNGPAPGTAPGRAGGLDETKPKVVVPVIWLVP